MHLYVPFSWFERYIFTEATFVRTAWQIDKGKSIPKFVTAYSKEKRETMIELYDKVKVKKRDVTGNVVSIDDNHGKDEPIYYVEIEDKYKTGEFLEDLVWCERDEIQLVEKF